NRRSARSWRRRRHSAHRRCCSADKKRARSGHSRPPPCRGQAVTPAVARELCVRSPRDAQGQPSPRSNVGSYRGPHWDHSVDRRRLEPTWRLKGKILRWRGIGGRGDPGVLPQNGWGQYSTGRVVACLIMISWGETGADVSLACTGPATFDRANVASDQTAAVAVMTTTATKRMLLRIVSPFPA